MIPREVTACKGDYKRAVLGSQSNRVCVDRLGIVLERLRSSLESCDLVSCLTLSGIVRAIAVSISELLSVHVSNLCKCCFSCYQCFVFSGIFENKVSFLRYLAGWTVFIVHKPKDFCNSIICEETKIETELIPCIKSHNWVHTLTMHFYFTQL
ncbi:hypothetical protein AVEN_175037-1 [Araneus ventricosus]|uniref:Uncharacterized protein n=1 Tax=Araneus ventricosus TaxID=182803 RepID=A0A4Y2QLK6_ARAVE|nr:hypothetical protein AVEN_175037-1 [Araneus ventricosus]